MTAGTARDGQAATLRPRVQVAPDDDASRRAEAWTGARRLEKLRPSTASIYGRFVSHPPAGVVGFGASNHGSLL